MRLLKNEDGVSEVVGALLILLIFVLFLGIVQVNEVPRWNKELEIQQFDRVYSDFVNLRSNLEDVSFKNIPKTSAMHMGVRYPERFMLRNPGAGAYGSITNYPLNVTISYNSGGKLTRMNLTSTGLVYEMNSITELPKLIYENGIIIKDFGNWNYTEDTNHLTTNNSFFIPVLMGVESVSAIEMETLNIFPIPKEYYITPIFSSMDITIETRYPEIWANLSNGSRPSGSKFSVDVANRTIKITDISGFTVRWFNLPDTAQLPGGRIYAGVIAFADSFSGMGGSSSCTAPGQYMSSKNQGCIDLAPSAGASQFIIQDISMIGQTSNAELRFYVRDAKNNEWEISVTLGSDPGGNATTATVDQKKPSGPGCSADLDSVNRLIDLTSCYRNASIITPNVLTIRKIDDDILHVNFLIN